MYHYRLEDTFRLASHGVPTMQLGNPKWALDALRAHVETGDELKEILGQYPAVRYEPLDFHYVCQQSLAVLDDHLMEDLVSRGIWAGYWGGYVWGAFLTGLSHEVRYLPFLDTRYEHFPRYKWLIDEVRAALTAPADTPPSPFSALLSRLRDQLKPLPRPTVQLRRALSPEAMEKRKAAVLEAYRKGDWDAALALTRT